MLSFCPKCDTPLQFRGELTGASWGVCPECGYADFIIAADLKLQNSSVEKELEQVLKGSGLPSGIRSPEELEEIQCAQENRKQVGSLSESETERFIRLCQTLCDDRPEQVDAPPLVPVNADWIKRTRPFTTRISRSVYDSRITGINIPIFHEQEQLVGHNALLPAMDPLGMRMPWLTYLNTMYAHMPRIFLSYRPEDIQEGDELVVTDNVSLWLKLLYWYDTARLCPSRRFPEKVFPVLLLGGNGASVHCLCRYYWKPSRITTLCQNSALTKKLIRRLQCDAQLECPAVRGLTGDAYELSRIRTARTREIFEKFIAAGAVELEITK